MRSELFEDTVELAIGVVEAELPTPEAPEGYPRARLRPLRQAELRTFQVYVLENDYLRAKVAPALGGRVVSLFDKRTNVELLPFGNPQLCEEGPPAGAALRAGLQLRLGEFDRPGALDWVESHADSPEEGEDATLWLGAIESGSGLSWHLAIVLPAESAELRLELRAFNRTLGPVPYHPRWVAHLPGATALSEGAIAYDAARSVGCGLFSIGQPADLHCFTDGELVLGRFPADSERFLAGRQSDVWRVTLTPYSGLPNLIAANTEAALGLEGTELAIQSASDLPGVKLLIATESGNQEAKIDVPCGTPLRVRLPAPPQGIALQDEAKREVLRWVAAGEPVAPVSSLPATAKPPRLPEGLAVADLRRATFHPAFRVEAHLRLARAAFAVGDYAGAYGALEEALLYNSDDPLAWWAKAVARRLSGEEFEENSDLLNAHYLAPLEPALRAESFLSQSPMMSSEPSALLASFDDHPESFVEVASLLLEHELFDQATRWIDEALRHMDLAMLRYLQAYAHLVGSRMRAEAAVQLEAAAKIAYGPPFPWREMESKALLALGEAFPEDAGVARLLALAGWKV